MGLVPGGQAEPPLPREEKEREHRSVPNPAELVSEAFSRQKGNKCTWTPRNGRQGICLPQREQLGRLLWAEAKPPVCHLPSMSSGHSNPGRATEVQQAPLHFGRMLHPPLGLSRKMSVSRGFGQKEVCEATHCWSGSEMQL